VQTVRLASLAVHQLTVSQHSLVTPMDVPMRVQVQQPSGLSKDVNVSFLGSQKSHTLRQELVEALKPQVLLAPQLLMHCMLAT
jgi:hypothetical protein